MRIKESNEDRYTKHGYTPEQVAGITDYFKRLNLIKLGKMTVNGPEVYWVKNVNDTMPVVMYDDNKLVHVDDSVVKDIISKVKPAFGSPETSGDRGYNPPYVAFGNAVMEWVARELKFSDAYLDRRLGGTNPLSPFNPKAAHARSRTVPDDVKRLMNETQKMKKSNLEALIKREVKMALGEAVNPELDKAVDRFVKNLASRYAYNVSDAVMAVFESLKRLNLINREVNYKAPSGFTVAESTKKILLTQLLKEAENKQTPGEKKEEKDEKSFAKTRLSGAEKIAETAKEKGGDAMLTYYHFNVKLPYYERASKGEFNPEAAREEYQTLVAQLAKATGEKGLNISQNEFQKLVGKIEVLGELLIEYKD